MPLPLGHTAVGLAVFKTFGHGDSRSSSWIMTIWIIILANLPDIDVIIGLMAGGNGQLFHRGPTHSLLFALISGWLASQAWRVNRHVPRLGLPICCSIVLSHVLADMIFTSAPVSLLWPMAVHWSGGSSGWRQIVHTLVFDSSADIGIVVGVALYAAALGLIRRSLPVFRPLAAVRRRRRSG